MIIASLNEKKLGLVSIKEMQGDIFLANKTKKHGGDGVKPKSLQRILNGCKVTQR